MKNKKGAEMTIGTIVIIILALVVLVVLIVGFTMGWGNFWSKMTSFIGGSSNIDTTIQACKTYCTTEAMNSFCKEDRAVKGEGMNGLIDSEIAAGLNKDKGTCKELYDNYKDLGFESCEAFTVAECKKE
ncbi:hypothetical protein GOV14_00345 [Candidatus Pacearchaeota archaeon]|nr:hypothetical protein [Candidatus Pacearchaeota archaeon]